MKKILLLLVMISLSCFANVTVPVIVPFIEIPTPDLSTFELVVAVSIGSMLIVMLARKAQGFIR